MLLPLSTGMELLSKLSTKSNVWATKRLHEMRQMVRKSIHKVIAGKKNGPPQSFCVIAECYKNSTEYREKFDEAKSSTLAVKWGRIWSHQVKKSEASLLWSLRRQLAPRHKELLQGQYVLWLSSFWFIMMCLGKLNKMILFFILQFVFFLTFWVDPDRGHKISQGAHPQKFSWFFNNYVLKEADL